MKNLIELKRFENELYDFYLKIQSKRSLENDQKM